MKAIIYESNTGFTAQYALILSEKLTLPAYTIKEAKTKLTAGDSVIFLGWIFAGMIQGYSKVAKLYKPLYVCAVGMNEPTEDMSDQIKKVNHVDAPVFYLRGGLDFNRLKGIKKVMLKTVVNKVIKENKPENQELINMLNNGGSFVREEELEKVLNAINIK